MDCTWIFRQTRFRHKIIDMDSEQIPPKELHAVDTVFFRSFFRFWFAGAVHGRLQ